MNKILGRFRSYRAESLSDRGYALLEDMEFEKALRISKKIKRLRYSASFEIAAAALAGLGRLEEAVEELERGVAAAPGDWSNWELLANYRSDLKRYDQAEKAYEQALTCPNVQESSIRLNQAILMNRRQRFDEALAILDSIQEPELTLQVAAARMDALYNAGRLAEAAQFGKQALASSGPEDDGDSSTVRIAVLLERIRMKQGASLEGVRARALELLARDHKNTEAMALIRETYGLKSPESKCFRCLIHKQLPENDPEAEGYYVWHEVVAESVDEAMHFIRDMELADGQGEVALEETKTPESMPGDLKGVYGRSGRIYWGDEK